MLFTADDLRGVASGAITVAVRRWKRPTVRAGGTLTTSVGVLGIDDVEEISEDEVTDEDAVAAGHPSAEALLASKALRRDGRLHRITFHLIGPDPRITLREQHLVDTDELDGITTRLTRFDRASGRGPWTAATLHLIQDQPGVRAASLAEEMQVETQRFKTDVRKLKALGLTESLEVGYRLSPRGATVLRCLDAGGPDVEAPER